MPQKNTAVIKRILVKLIICGPVVKDLQTVAVNSLLKRDFVSCVKNLVRPTNENERMTSNEHAPKSNQMAHTFAEPIKTPETRFAFGSLDFVSKSKEYRSI